MADSPLILTVDDDPDLVDLIDLKVRQWGFKSAGVLSADALWEFLERRVPPVILLDVMLGDADGGALVAEIKGRWPETQVISITRGHTVEAAVRCMKNGASDFITKPLDFEALRRAIRSALEVVQVADRARQSEAGNSDDAPTAEAWPGMIGRSPQMAKIHRAIANIAPTDVSVLILGETGTGKELAAHAIHAASRRCAGPFIAVNAAAIPRELIESMLFGHQKGAFTGASEHHTGYCEQADGGTLFLDEIAEMDFELQAKLLRFLQDHVLQPIGARETRKVDVRVVAATNTDPMEQIAQHTLREDLYYRLRVVSLPLPPLRQRDGDITVLAQHFLQEAANRHDRKFKSLSPQAEAMLENYPWPGNVRQLKHFIEEAVVMHRGDVLQAEMLPDEIFNPPQAVVASGAGGLLDPSSERPLSQRELRDKRQVIAALEKAAGRPEEAARELGVSRATIYRRLKKYGLH